MKKAMGATALGVWVAFCLLAIPTLTVSAVDGTPQARVTFIVA
jgi:hypothetical protein